ncbi:MAG: hypothetical protein ACKVOH_06725 [Chlamydiales bacterium]
MQKIWLFLLCLCSTAFGQITLKECLRNSPEGSYFVTQSENTQTFLFIRSCDQDKIIIEEVSIPAANKDDLNWKVWFEAKAPGHTLWTISQINLSSGSLEETFSFTHMGWIDRKEAHTFLSTLLNLSFYEVPEGERKKVGFPPKHGQQDKRKLWTPPHIVEGNQIEGTPFIAYYTRWPNDNSEMARHRIEIYLPKESTDYPSCFPSWIEVDAKVTQVRLRVIDSGLGAKSPQPSLPYRPPAFVGQPTQTEKGLQLFLKAPSYFQEFIVMAEESDTFAAKPTILPHTLSRQEDKIVLTIANEDFAQLDQEQNYLFVVSPKEAPECTISTEYEQTCKQRT